MNLEDTWVSLAGMNALLYLRKLLVAVWIGKIVFFASSIAPTVFRVLSRSDAASLQAQIFPKYFGLGLVATGGVLIISLVLCLKHRGQRGQKRFLFTAALSAIALGVYANLYFNITPEILRLQPEVLLLPKDSTEAVVLEFAKIHSLSTTLNVAVLVLGLVCLALI